MTIYTSYFAKVKQLKETGLTNLVCIAGYAPKFFFDMDGARFYPDLAPKREWWIEWKGKFKDNLSSEEAITFYVQQYKDTVLAKMNPIRVIEELGDNVVMLCYETPDKFCHRHLVARWLKMNIPHIQVEEVKFQ